VDASTYTIREEKAMKTRTLLALAVCTCMALPAASQTLVSPDYFVETVASGLTQATNLAFIGPSEMLVNLKASGQVQHVVNGVVVGTALDLPVNSASERGLLGICLDPNFATNGFVYLYYSRSTTSGDTTTSTQWSDNRVERYVYDNGTLTLDTLVMSVPSDPNQPNGPNHDGGIIMFGPDGKLYIITGELNRDRAEQNNQGQANVSSHVGGIFRLNSDGSIPADNPFFDNPNADFHKFFAYGIRNSFGMTVDPLTNHIWYTENGPTSYDEVNYVPGPGLNSGWNEIMGPDDRDPQGVGNLVMFPHAYYHDPEFSWLSTIAVTSILFLTSDKFGLTERNQCLIGDSNNGNLYLFDVNANRDGFVLTDTLADKVADNTTERNLNRWGQGWSTPTDFDIGPDGYVYVTSLALGKVLRIRPVQEDVAPTSLSMVKGSILSGGLGSVLFSDNAWLVTRPGVVFTTQEPPIQVAFESTSPFASPTNLKFSIEGHASTNNIAQGVQLFNFDTNQYETLDTRTATMTDSTTTVEITSNIGRFIGPDNKLRAKMTYRAQGPVFTWPYTSSIDRVWWHEHH
jgi:glucose/arabinose dehydrogenase